MWKDDAVVHMARAFEDFAKKGYFDANVSGNKWPAGQVDFGNGKVAMYYNLTGLPTEVADIPGPEFQWGCTLLAVNKNTADPELAMEFVAYALSKENDAKMVEHAGTTPATVDTQWPPALANMKDALEFVEVPLKAGGDITSNPDLSPTISENFIKLAAGQITGDEFVANMAAAAKR